MSALAVLGVGMVTPVGLTAPASCAAMRAGLARFEETRFIDKAGEWIMGADVPLEEPWRGIAKLAKMAARAIREALSFHPQAKDGSLPPILLCVAEPDRPGRPVDLAENLTQALETELSVPLPRDCVIFEAGRVGAAYALAEAREHITRKTPVVLVVGVDSYLSGATLGALDADNRLLTADNSDGFIPGEAASAILVSRAGGSGAQLRIDGIGFAQEPAHMTSGEPLRGDGLAAAIKAALAEAGCDLGALDYRIADVSGAQYGFKEAALALAKTLRTRKERFTIEHPAESVGETGAAALGVMIGATLAAQRKSYAEGPGVLAHLANDDGARAALILRFGGA